MQKPPRVSIVLPTYNGQKYLLSAIASCLFQTYEDFELIIVDDASTDGTSDIIASVDDPRIIRKRNAINRKLPATLNIGFSASQGEYLTWISDDNQFTRGAIQRLVEYLDDNPEVDFVYTGYYIMDGAGDVREKRHADPPELILNENVVGACFMYRRSVPEKIGGYDEALVYVQDYEYWLRVAKNCKMAALDEFLYFYRFHESTQTNKLGRYELEISAANLLEGRERRYRLSRMYERYAYYQFCQGQKLKSIKSLVLSFYYQPTRLLSGEIVVNAISKIPKIPRHL